MKNKLLSKKGVRIVLFLIVLLIAGGYFLKRKPSEFHEVQNNQISWRIPDLPEGFNWVENEANEEDIENNKILFNDRYEKSTAEDIVIGYIKAPGKIYTVKLTDKDWNYKDAGHATETILKKSLEGTGWSLSKRVGNHVVYGTASSGVKSSVTGYVRVEGDLVRTVVFSYIYEGNWITPENEPPYLQCPCTVNMTVFISEPVSLEQYFPLP